MDQKFEEIKNKTTCPDCSGKEMVFGFSSGDGNIYKATSIFGTVGLQRATTKIMIICKNCGLLVKSYANEPKKL